MRRKISKRLFQEGSRLSNQIRKSLKEYIQLRIE